MWWRLICKQAVPSYWCSLYLCFLFRDESSYWVVSLDPSPLRNGALHAEIFKGWVGVVTRKWEWIVTDGINEFFFLFLLHYWKKMLELPIPYKFYDWGKWEIAFIRFLPERICLTNYMRYDTRHSEFSPPFMNPYFHKNTFIVMHVARRVLCRHGPFFRILANF